MIPISEKDLKEALHYLSVIFRAHRVEPDTVSIERFEDGISNKNYLVSFKDAPDDRYALRIPGYGSEGMVDRTDERCNNRLASQLGITSELVYFNADDGVKVAKYIEGAETMHADSIKSRENLRQVAAILRTLHSAPIRFHKDFNVFTEIHRYEKLLDNVNGKMYDGYYEVRDRILGLEDSMNTMGLRVAPCHCDTLAENWIKGADGRIHLIDWEYSGMNDPYWDVTAPFIEDDFSEEDEEYFLEQYFEGNVPTVAAEKVLYYKILMDYLWSIWARVKELDGADLREYGLMRLARALENLKKF